MVLRDSFMASDKVKILMLACVCPGSTSADHTLNTLRYAERLKERPMTGMATEAAPVLRRGMSNNVVQIAQPLEE